MNEKPCISRRKFFRKTGALATAAIALPQIVPSSFLGNAARAAPSERISLGWIGTGGRGTAVMSKLLTHKDAQGVAVCDVKAWRREAAKKKIDEHHGGTGCVTYNDFRELVARKDIDAVLVASTDHWHVLHSIAAAKAGMDIYMEKPMGLCMAECVAMREAIRAGNRVFQFGTQQRSYAQFRVACELARNQRIGKLHTINVWSPGGITGGSTAPVPVPEGLDYNMWLGPAPFKPYTKDRCSNSLWWHISDYALGFIAGWGIHPMDIASWGGGELLNCPVEIEGTGQFPCEGVCDTATNWRITLKFSSGVTLNFAGHPRPAEWKARYPGTHSHGTAFEGTEGWVHVNRQRVNSRPASLVGSVIGPDEVNLYKSDHHAHNFLDCVKSRKKTICDIDEALRSETLCQVSEIAIRLGRKLTWDPASERFVGDAAANRWLSRSMRTPWKL